ncbi:DUF4145 domain-containing protein [Buttiauxella agrestis]|uniref:DUF4145 domain-containing protein n=1 Tax=Buttiauxella agrestis TaxID=82977 RepID=UPI00397666A6
MSSWECPYCGRLATERAVQNKSNGFGINADTKHGAIFHSTDIYVCPNPECKEYTIYSYVTPAESRGGYLYETDVVLEAWQNRPQGIAKCFPDYIPKAILDDYNEAALITNLSPKASATLSRRCLQGMIRDFWQVKEKNLHLEIQAIQDKVAADIWLAIDAIRSIGNIGAHMEKDIDLIIDVQPEEAQLLLQLIETLLKDWYVERENRRIRAEAIVNAALQKKQLKQT